MAAIRWDNIDAPNFNGVSAILDAAGRSMNTGLTALQTPVAEANALVSRNWDTTRTNNTNAALAKGMEFTDPEKLKEAMRSGLYQQLIGDGSAPIDERAVMAALDSRVGVLQNRGVAEMHYNNAVTDNAQQAVRRNGLISLLKGDPNGVLEAATTLRDPSALVQAGINQQHYTDAQKMAQANFDLKKSLTDAQIALTNAKAGDPDNFTVTGGGGSKGKVGADGKPLLSEEDAQARAEAELAIKESIYSTPYSLDATAKFVKDNIKDDSTRTGIMAGVSGLDARGHPVGGGNFLPYTQAVVQQAALEIGDSFGSSWRTSSRFANKVKEIMDRPGVADAIIEGKGLRQLLASDPIAQQKMAVAAKMQMLRPLAQEGGATKGAAAQDSVTAFMANPRVRNFVPGGYQEPVPVDPRTAPAANQTPVIPAQAVPTRITYGQLMGTSGGDEKKKEVTTDLPTSTPLLSKEDRPSASVGLSLSPSGGLASIHPSAVKIPEVDWRKPQVVHQAAPGAIPKGGGERAVVTYVGDGDGAKLRKEDGSTLDCRIDRIDAPEVAHGKYGKKGQPYGDEARKTLQELIENKEVTVRVAQPAPSKNYDRSLCQIEVEGKDVSTEMIQAGAAWLYRRYANDPAMGKLESEARAARRGLWNSLNPEYPENFKRRMGY